MSTLDVYPNYISGSLTLSAANTFTTLQVELPINRLGRTTGNRAQMMEFLWVEVDANTVDFAAEADRISFTVSLGPVPTSVPTISSGDTVTAIRVTKRLATNGATLFNNHFVRNLQSREGFGFLVATEHFHVSGNTTGMAGATVFDFRIYYRFVTIPIAEFLGMLQSQQA